MESYRLLTSELVAWKGQDFETPVVVFIMQLGKLGIICFVHSKFEGVRESHRETFGHVYEICVDDELTICQASFTCYINHNENRAQE